MSLESVRGECLLDFRSLAAPTLSGFCRHHDRRRKWKCCSSLLRKKHLTEKSYLPYKPDSSRGGSRPTHAGHRASEVAHMDLAGVQRLTCSLPAVSRLHSLTHNSIPNHAAIIFPSEGLVRLGPAEDTARQRQHSHAGRSRSSLDHVT